MKRSRVLLWLLIAAGIGAAIALAVAQRQRRRLEQMSDAELRAFLEQKLGERVPPEQLALIQDAVVAKVRRRKAGTTAVTGTISYLEADPMPKDAVVIVQVLDTSMMDPPADEIGAQVIDGPPAVPVQYSVGFDRADIVDDHSYSVRATISSGDQLLWTTDTHYPVITGGNPMTADLQLVAVPQSV